MLNIGDNKYYQTNEACQIAGITKNTFFRWVEKGVFRDVTLRDRRGWRLFTQADMERLKAEANKVQTDIPDKKRSQSRIYAPTEKGKSPKKSRLQKSSPR